MISHLFSDSNFIIQFEQVNLELKKLCIRKKIQYTNLYRSFLLNNRPDSSLYAPRDGLHLNFAGTSLLRKNIISSYINNNYINITYIYLSSRE
jgi:lysophospholipase L1-like esterase